MQQVLGRVERTNALFGAPQARTVDSVVSAYMKSVNEQMVEVAGIRYHDVYKSLHGEVVPLDRIRDAVERGVRPGEFVDAVVRDFGLNRLAAGMDSETVKAFNRTQCAIVEFSAQSEDWTLSPTGKVFKQEEDGVAQIGPVRERTSGHMGVGITFHEGVRIGEDGRLDGEASELVNVAADFDIGEAVAKYDATREMNSGMRL
jgi:hypothetical protein